MKKEFVVKLNLIDELKGFVNEMRSISCDIDAIFERQVVDAKSILGLISLSSNPIKIVLNSEDKDEIEKFCNICKKYEVEVNG